jgi:hypothetical protein
MNRVGSVTRTVDRKRPLLSHGQVDVYRRSDGVTVARWADNAVVTYEDAAAIQGMVEQLAPDETNRLLLVDTTNVIRTEIKARRVRPDDTVVAVAIIVGSPVSRMFANAFLAIRGPEIPMRIFTDVEVAAGWLKEQVA